MNELGIPLACYIEETTQLFKILTKRYGKPNEMGIEDPKVTSWEFIEDSFKVLVTWDNGEVDLYDPKDISSSEELSFLKQLFEIPIINNSNNSGNKFAERLQNACSEFTG
ncbi:hypothetical protein HanIR_Chr16g0805781 [Helianthus annuus]|nr:hypothetical protein HanIR_Chr16g0805781 [Helianthus annuus]